MCRRTCPNTYEDLVEEVLDELLLERAGGEKAVEIGSEELSDEVANSIVSHCSSTLRQCAYMSSSGEMKMSLKLITCRHVSMFP